MMREIKFRGKTEWGTWCYGGYTKINNEKSDIWEYSASEIPTCPSVTPCTVLADTVGQYTGLTDKNGVEVYEGDILRYTNVDRDDRATFLPCVAWRNCGFIVYDLNDPEEWQAFDDEAVQVIAQIMEVFANIHDSPELLNAETSEK